MRVEAADATEIAKARLRRLELVGGRRTRVELDADVALFLALAMPTMIGAEAHKLCLERYGKDRTPSRSAIHRFWKKLREH